MGKEAGATNCSVPQPGSSDITRGQCPRMTAVFSCQEKRNSNMHPDKCIICTGGEAHVKRSIRAAGPSNFGDDMCIVTHLLLDIFMKKRSLIWPHGQLSYLQHLN